MPRHHHHHHNIKRNAERFHELAPVAGQPSALQAVLEKMSWGKNELVLDHSFHAAKFIHQTIMKKVEEMDATVYRVDNCKQTIEFHKKHYHHHKINHVFADIGANPEVLGDLKFNKFFSLYGLFVTTNYKAGIKTIYDHLLPGGEGYFVVPFKSNKLDLNKYIAEDSKWKEHSQFVANPDYVSNNGTDNTGKLKEALTEAGFKIMEWETQEHSYPFKNLRTFVHFVLAGHPHKEHLEPEEQKELEDFCCEYLLKTPTEDFTPGEPNAEDKEYILRYTTANVYVSK